ncbi:uncharacterized protein Tco025E_07090 [Trypanosoma conorhini]|uniref:Uncharacterized protein n=1 Tax=Trypanosoma conorhini TaxID=83891 RepID=A0A3R7KLH9_9TRYP|nr:uncharacterized protein Tco025E_07090 [Trypanosoma conorhini]RNF08833.1 hypothetical protein Tco025E_07090 [Trypanosoma conorhini]
MGTGSDAVSLCRRIVQSVNDATTSRRAFLHESSIVGWRHGYLPVEGPAYLLLSQASSSTPSMLVGYRVIGATAAALLLAKLAYGFYHFKGLAFIRASEQEELS